jgi:hypothetical protein
MNRHDRRAAAKARKGTGYLGRVISGAQALGCKPGVSTIAVFHDSWCDIYRGCDCNCNPDIHIQEYGKDLQPTKEVIVIDDDGQVERVKKV